MAFDGAPRVSAVLGPTNTGKTHYAVERMLAHRTGVIGLPLRLLAREVYDRIVSLRGPSVVALVTGEERIVPPRAAWWVSTVEAMPVDIGADFLAVDEIQLCGDPDRGHIFTDRLLNARGLQETLFLGAETMRARIASLVPGPQLIQRERFSRLSYTGPRKISRMPPRSAVVGFSVEDVYAIAELIRRQKGGAAVVMGALSPRTRNAQVALYQNGDVDYLVATDAIGMGLNLDIAHVAFSGLVKFDGRRHRHLSPSELAQIAGRAGRYTSDGTFGVTGDAPPLEPGGGRRDREPPLPAARAAAVAELRAGFRRAPRRSSASLEAPAGHPDLQRAREADDLATLKELSAIPEVRDRLRGPPDTRLLWDVCQIPDFRKVTLAEHASLCVRIFRFLQAGGGIPTDWLARQISRIDRTDGDIDALSKRLAYIRTWTYVAQRRAWVDDADHWRDETRAVEDRLSDALHVQLTQRFVDRRTSVLMRGLKQRESLLATVTENGEVRVEDQFIGRLEGFRFRLDPTADADQARTLRAAGLAALAPALSLRADKFYNAPDTEIDVTEQGGLMWGEYAVGKLAAGPDALSPQIQPFVDEDAAPEVAEKVRRRLGHWVDRRIAALFQPLIALQGRRDADRHGARHRLPPGRGAGRHPAQRGRRGGQGARPGEPREPAQARRAFRPVHGLPAAPAQARAHAPPPRALVAGREPRGLPRIAAARARDHGRRAGRASGLLFARRLSTRRGEGDPHRHAGAAGGHDPQPRRPCGLRGRPRDAVDHRPLARAVRQADAGHGLRCDRGNPAEAQAPAGRRRSGGDRGGGGGRARAGCAPAGDPRPRPARRAGAAAGGGAPRARPAGGAGFRAAGHPSPRPDGGDGAGRGTCARGTAGDGGFLPLHPRPAAAARTRGASRARRRAKRRASRSPSRTAARRAARASRGMATAAAASPPPSARSRSRRRDRSGRRSRSTRTTPSPP